MVSAGFVAQTWTEQHDQIGMSPIRRPWEASGGRAGRWLVCCFLCQLEWVQGPSSGVVQCARGWFTPVFIAVQNRLTSAKGAEIDLFHH